MRARGTSGLLVILTAVLLVVLVPTAVAAASLLNGDFEAGNLSGWHVHPATQAGNWFAYTGTAAPIGGKRGADPVQAPPHGSYAVIADEANPDTLILYQDITLDPGSKSQLSLLAYYNSYEPIAIPTPDTLSVDEEDLAGQSNQQFRIDLMKPEAPLESVVPGDILRTVFETKAGAPTVMSPTRFAANLTPFAGQTVRLRIAVAAHEEVLNAGVDAVSVSNSTGQIGNGAVRFRIEKVKPSRRDGTIVLRVKLPGPGVATAEGQLISAPAPVRPASLAKKLHRPIRPAFANSSGAGRVALHLRPTPLARAILEQKHRLRVKVTVAYRPTDGSRETASLPVVFRLDPHRRR
jgi:hypothetical protein